MSVSSGSFVLETDGIDMYLSKRVTRGMVGGFILGTALVVGAGAVSSAEGGLKLVGKEVFVATPRAGVRVVGDAFYARKTGGEMVSWHFEQTKSDKADVGYRRVSADNGRTWSAGTEVTTHRNVSNGTMRRHVFPGFVDPERGVLMEFILEGVLPNDNPLEGMKHWTVRYRLSKDGGKTYYHESQVIQAGNEYDEMHPLPGVWVGKNSIQIGDTASVPIRLDNGDILQPVQITPIGPDGEYYNPGGGYTYHDSGVLIGRWNDSGTVDWVQSALVKGDPKRSTRGMIEPTSAQMKDGRVLMVMRGSNDKKPSIPGRRWYAVSTDRGRTWSETKPWTYADGATFFSPSSCSQLLRHSNGRLFWIGNISPTNPRGNHPRYPLVIGEVDEGSMLLKRETLCTIDDRRPEDPEGLQISNFYAREDRETGEILVHASPFNRPHRLTKEQPVKKLDWTGDAMLYRIGVD